MNSQRRWALAPVSGVIGRVRLIVRKFLASLYHREVQYILLKRVASQQAGSPVPGERSETEITCLLVESAPALQEVVKEMSATMRDSVDQLKQRVAQGCIVLLAWQPQPSGARRELIGYILCEHGIFSALGRRGKVSADILFTHYHEILPEYRGRRIADVMRGALEAYCRAQGLTKRCAVISPSNEPSLHSSLRAGYTIAGTIVRTSVLRGLVVWETPWEHIKRAVCGDGQPEESSGVPAEPLTAPEERK